jgi:hypothetical protein
VAVVDSPRDQDASFKGGEMSKVKTYGKKMPKNEARPLGTKKPRREKKQEVDASADITQFMTQAEKLEYIAFLAAQPMEKVVDTPNEEDVESPIGVEAIQPDQPAAAQQEQNMTLTLKGLSKNGKRAIYDGAAISIHLPVGAFDGYPPATLEGPFKAKAVKQAKPKLTKEERAALRASKPKPTEAERIARAEANLAKRKAKLAAVATM